MEKVQKAEMDLPPSKGKTMMLRMQNWDWDPDALLFIKIQWLTSRIQIGLKRLHTRCSRLQKQQRHAISHNTGRRLATT